MFVFLRDAPILSLLINVGISRRDFSAPIVERALRRRERIGPERFAKRDATVFVGRRFSGNAPKAAPPTLDDRAVDAAFAQFRLKPRRKRVVRIEIGAFARRFERRGGDVLRKLSVLRKIRGFDAFRRGFVFNGNAAVREKSVELGKGAVVFRRFLRDFHILFNFRILRKPRVFAAYVGLRRVLFRFRVRFSNARPKRNADKKRQKRANRRRDAATTLRQTPLFERFRAGTAPGFERIFDFGIQRSFRFPN